MLAGALTSDDDRHKRSAKSIAWLDRCPWRRGTKHPSAARELLVRMLNGA
jgi:hypothetical protein